jgi:hypothetical protein
MATSFTGGTGLQPHPIKGAALNENYLSFTGNTGGNFAQQYLPELYEAEVERYGNRTIGGFLRMVGAEMPMSSDQVVWSEQNRLHIGYKDAAVTSNTRITITLSPGEKLALRVLDLIVVQGAAGELVCEVTAVDPASGTTPYVDVKPYEAAGLTTGNGAIFTNADKISLFVFGSEHGKGSSSTQETLQPSFTKFDNKPMIIRDEFKVNGSDTAQIGWVEVATEDGTSGYLWYMKAESETRLRFEDYLEMTMVEAVKKNADGTATEEGSEGLFSAIKSRGNVMAGFSAAGQGTGAVADFDEILKGLDKEGAIEENMLFVNRALALDIDDMLAQVNGGYAGTGANLGASFGLFNNEAEMALNLGFSGFRRGSYDFYKSDWKYLNDASTRGVLGLNPNSPLSGLTGTVEGVLVPAGTSTVYDQALGSNIRRPFLHVRYRASETDDRRMKSWVTGSVGGAYTSGLDAMEVHFLSERCLCVQGANNFVLFTS